MQPSQPYRCFLGWDANEIQAYNVAETSLYLQTGRLKARAERISILSLFPHYNRPTTQMPSGQLFDEHSGAPMSTSHAIARFFVPFVCRYQGWALFTDGDVLFRESVANLFALADPQYAVMVVQHPPQLEEGTKKAGHIQQAYPRKNWSSVMLFNCGHPANEALTLEVLNTLPGRDLHAFKWLDDSLIGALPSKWNHLVGVSGPPDEEPALVHFTLGTPNLPGQGTGPYVEDWWDAAASAGYRQKAVV